MKTEVMKHEQFGEVRTVVLDAVKWFAGRDVAITLGYKKRPDSFITKHVEKEDKQIVMLPSLPLSPSSVMRQTVVVNDKGVNSLCDAAFCDFAEDIKHWLLNVGNSAEKPANNALQLFNDAEFGKFRWTIIDGVIWFVAADMCRILGFADVTSALRNLDDDEKSSIVLPKNGVTNTPLPERAIDDAICGWIENRVNVVNEFGLYRLIMASRKPGAKKFQRKVYHEILPSIRKYGYYSVKGEEPAKKTLKPLVPVAVVYAVLFANLLVKIGITSDFYRRLKELRKETHQDIIAFVTTPFKPLDDARLLELTLKAKFFDRLVNGEFFNVDFDTVKAAIVAPDDKFNKLLALADRLPDSDEKTRLVLQAASLV